MSYSELLCGPTPAEILTQLPPIDWTDIGPEQLEQFEKSYAEERRRSMDLVDNTGPEV